MKRSLLAAWLLVISQVISASGLSARGTVTAAGTITLNGQRAQNLKAYFWHERSKTEVVAETDAIGRYSVDLMHEGDWMIYIRNWSQTGRFIAQDGNTPFDWAVVGGALQVTLEGGSAPATIEMRRTTPDFLALRAIPAGVSSYTFEAIPLGTFQVRASNDLGLSEIATVTFSPSELHQQTRLRLPQ